MHSSWRAMALLGLAWAGSAAAGVASLQPQQQLVDLATVEASQRAEVDALVAKLRQDVQRGDSGQAVKRLANAHPALLQHWAAHALLRELAQGERLPAAQPLLDWAKQQPVKILQRHAETAADWFVPLFDPAAAARDVERSWQASEAQAQWRDRLTAQPATALKATATEHIDQQGQAAAALGQLSATEFEALQTVMKGLQPQQVAADVWLAAAEREVSLKALHAVMTVGRPEQRAQVPGLAAQLPAAEAKSLLSTLEEDAELASAATLLLVPLLLREDPQHPGVLARLQQPSTQASTAAALSRLPEAQRLQGMQQLWKASSTAAQRAGLRLALQLDGRGEARRALQEWSDAEAQQ